MLTELLTQAECPWPRGPPDHAQIIHPGRAQTAGPHYWRMVGAER